MIFTAPLSVLCAPSLLRAYARGEAREVPLVRHCHAEAWRRESHVPDHMRRNAHDALYGGVDDSCGVLLRSVETLATRCLEIQGDDIQVREEWFEAWQEIIAEVSPLVLMAWMIATAPAASALRAEQDRRLIERNIRPSIFPGVRQPLLEGLSMQQGLYDLHVHLNGSTPADAIWLEALARPRAFRGQLERAWEQNREEVEGLFLQYCPDFTWRDVPNLVDLAVALREWLVAQLFRERLGPEAERLSEPSRQSRLGRVLRADPLRWTFLWPTFDRNSWATHPLEDILPAAAPWCRGEHLHEEACFLVQLFRFLRASQATHVARCAHYYFLIQNAFCRMLVQQVDQNGFDQFQRITLTGLREHSERTYSPRFEQFVHSARGARLHVEGRFAPKGDAGALYALLVSIGEGYAQALERQGKQDQADLTLRLVAHFIKERERRAHYGCQFYRLRRDLAAKARRLVNYQQGFGDRSLVAGVDAAGNELQAPPEVFAPVFRYLRRRNMTNVTFHVGEDFRHLASGIRAVHEAVEFLELGAGARIGHGTAVGIDPGLWRERVGPSLSLLRVEWLDTLVYAHRQLLEGGRFASQVAKAAETISELSREVYGEPVPPQILWEAWRLRKLDPICAFIDHDRTQCLSAEDWVEWDDIRKAMRANECHHGVCHGGPRTNPYEIFMRYHEENVFGKYNPEIKSDPESYRGLYVDVETDFFDNEALLYMQRAVLKMLVDRRVAIEALISSNVRISFYKSYDEHHIARWLGVGGGAVDEPRPTVCLGTDDPGIFATSIWSECLHLQRILKGKNVSCADAIGIIARLLENSFAYRFTLPPEQEREQQGRERAMRDRGRQVWRSLAGLG